MEDDDKNKFIKSLLRSMRESGPLKEEIVTREIERARRESDARELLSLLYLDEDREESFNRYCESAEFRATLDEIARHARYNLDAKVCEIGAGHGFLAVALARSGFRDVTIVEPNSEWISGTGYISELATKLGVHVWNDLDSWYESSERYDLIITKACIHHFSNPVKVIAEIRCKTGRKGKWIAMDEFYAYSAKHLYHQLALHPHILRYGQYEWPYSASMYIEMFRSVGFRIREIIPAGYKKNYISRNVTGNVRFAALITFVTDVLTRLNLTVAAFRIENGIRNLIGNPWRAACFVHPQVMVFENRAIELPGVPSEC